MNHTTIRLAIIVIAATLMISGTIFYPMVRKQQAYSATSATHQVKSEEEAAVRSSLQQRGQQQHMDQENLCLRAGKCNNSNVGEQTLGNDNSVTGFSDQSKNVQATVTVSPTPTPTVTPTPAPATCEQCFNTILTPEQISTIISSASIAQACASLGQISQGEFRTGLIDLGIPPTTVDDLISCLLKAGVVFAT